MSVNPPIYNSPSFRELTCLFNVSSFAQGPASVKTRIKNKGRNSRCELTLALPFTAIAGSEVQTKTITASAKGSDAVEQASSKLLSQIESFMRYSGNIAYGRIDDREKLHRLALNEGEYEESPNRIVMPDILDWLREGNRQAIEEMEAFEEEWNIRPEHRRSPHMQRLGA